MTHLRPIPAPDALPSYPLDHGTRLPGHYFLTLEFGRWLSSRFALNADYEVVGIALTLIMKSQMQRPVGTLPADPGDLALLVQIDARRWQHLTSLEFGPLYGWQPCQCGHEVRLMHPTVLEHLEDAIDRRTRKRVSDEKAAVRKRMQRLREVMRDLGCAASVIADDALVARIDDWMADQVRGNRRQQDYERALMHAANEGWFGGVTGHRS